MRDALIIDYVFIIKYFFGKKIKPIPCLIVVNLFALCPVVYL